jgi:hypothetical protein
MFDFPKDRRITGHAHNYHAAEVNPQRITA